jgi:flagellar basal-body rod protein FlgF
MFRGVYSAATGMFSYERKQQMLANNLANALTPGYKQEQAVFRGFPEMLIQQMQGNNSTSPFPKSNSIGTLHTGTYLQEGIASFIQGDLRETNRTTDFALNDNALPINEETDKKGTLLFAVQRDNDTYYSRSGDFTVDENGFLVTNSGDFVLDQSFEKIQVSDNTNFTYKNGQILQGGQVSANLWIGYTEESNNLMKAGEGLLSWQGNEEEAPKHIQDATIANQDNFSMENIVKQGFIEQSNVDVTKTMTEMMATVKMYEANQKVLQAYDRSMEKAVNEIGRLY